MNIIELIQDILLSFPKINEVCNSIHVDFTEDSATNYGLSPTGDTLVQEDVLGNQTRKHNFTLYAVYQSASDYDRIANSGTLLELQYWLENHALGQAITVVIGDTELAGTLKKLTCNNGMLYAIPNNDLNDGVMYQLQITAEYIIESEEI